MNNSGYKSGLYADPDRSSEYIRRIQAYLDRRNAAWLDRHVDWATGEAHADAVELCSLWRLDSHLAEWCARTGRLARLSVPWSGIKHSQIGRLTSLVYFRSDEDHRALAFEAKRFLDEVEAELIGRSSWDS